MYCMSMYKGSMGCQQKHRKKNGKQFELQMKTSFHTVQDAYGVMVYFAFGSRRPYKWDPFLFLENKKNSLLVTSRLISSIILLFPETKLC